MAAGLRFSLFDEQIIAVLYSPPRFKHVMSPKWALLFTALLIPLSFWAFLAIFARKRPGILDRLYPRLKTLCWIMWVCAVTFICLNLITWPPRTPFKFWPLLLIIYNGLMLVRNWVGRRVNPGRYVHEPRHGWWPSPKDS